MLRVLQDFLKANNLKVDWDGIERAPNEALVNALAMMSPYGAPEKQALLEAPNLKVRAEICRRHRDGTRQEEDLRRAAAAVVSMRSFHRQL